MSLLPELLLTVLFGTQASFTHPGVILPQKEAVADNELKDIVKRTQRSKEAREVLGFSPRVWRAMTETIRSGNDQLVANQHHLIHKVWDLAMLGRNLLAAKEKAQNLAAEEGFEAEIRRLLDICIEKASKPITPNPDKAAHENQMLLKTSYKKMLITSLQFLNNLISTNETRKLHLWLHLFGTPSFVAAATNSTPNKNSAKAKAKASAKPQPASGSGVGSVGNIAVNTAGGISSYTETVAKCNSLSVGFNAKYYKPGFLTEVPRILQPDEIEALPMILHSGVVALEGADQAMQSVRCKLMLAQGHGRNLLREILVFLGAWEVDEDDFCYRMMTRVTDAILVNGLISYAYECLRYEKDIVSPAQAVLIKLLISVCKPSKPSTLGRSFIDPASSSSSSIPFRSLTFVASPLPRADGSEQPPMIETSIPTFFITVFRKHVLPAILKIVKMQGAVHSGSIGKEKFEFSLWDLDRIYEGLYQFFDLLVLFTEDEETKKIMTAGGGGLVGDLVELLAELDKAIPRYVATKVPPPHPLASTETLKETRGSGSLKVEDAFKVERPFDVDPEGEGNPDDEYDEDEDGLDDDRALQEPEEFSWPHMKRFAVLLLSNLSWRNPSVQDLVREKKGLHLVLGQCMIDDDNPFIREHAILCLRNLLEENEENQQIVKELEAVQTVPSEVLDKQGWEFFIDDHGRVQLKRKPVAKNVRP